jgi:UDP-3-O-acyl N-acetylglucosamine deacetylase
MSNTSNQRTIGRTVAVEGYGYWSGRDVRVEFRPAGCSSGVVFVRRDMPGCPQVAADIENRLDVPLRTSLGWGHVRVDMVEHIMAALAGMKIDNCEVWVNEAELPGCDGSSLPFVRALESAGIVEQPVPRRRLIVQDIVRLGGQDSWIEARPSASGRTTLEYHLDYGIQSPIRRQSYRLSLSPASFRAELAPCRTFCLEEEARRLLAQGLGRRASIRDLLVFGPDGPIENTLRFPDECVRHKLLDLVGDLALAGCELVGHITAHRSGHRLNGELVRTLVPDGRALQNIRCCA